MDELERIEKRVDEMENDFKEFRKVFYELEKKYITTSNKVDEIWSNVKDIKANMKKPIEILINIITPLISSGVTWLIAYFIMKGGK